MGSWKLFATTAGLAVLLAACSPPDSIEPEISAAEEPSGSADEPAGLAPVATEGRKELALRFVSPNRGPATGGNEVTIDGQGFGGYPHVRFGGVPAWIRSLTPTEIRVTVPPPAAPIAAGETRVVDVAVTLPPAGSAPVSATLTQAYFYVAAAGEATTGEEPEPPQASAPATTAEAVAEPGAQSGVESSAQAKRVPAGPALVARFRFEVASESSEECAASHEIRFTDRSASGATEWLWEFGDGANSTERHPVHCYATPGMRSVTLTVSNDLQSSSASEIVIVDM